MMANIELRNPLAGLTDDPNVDSGFLAPLPPPRMISDEGLRLIKSFEGYGRKLPNGDCTAYQDNLGGNKRDIPTIGYGCTEGVRMGMVWTQAQAEEALRREVNKHVNYVLEACTYQLNQNQLDALSSFSYNVGPGNMRKIVGPLNKGDVMGTAKKFDLFVYAQGQRLPGLVSRRAREKALFLKPAVQPSEPYMPQSVDDVKEPWSHKTKVVVATGCATAASNLQQLTIPKIDTVQNFLDTGQKVRGLTSNFGEFSSWLFHQPVLLIALVLAGWLIWTHEEG